MTPLEAAWLLLADRPPRGGTQLQSLPRGRCYYCLNDARGEPHAPDCPWRSMSKIVAALEAAERLGLVVQEYLGDRQNVSWQWPELAAAADVLVAALREPEA